MGRPLRTCAHIVPNKLQQEASERYRTIHQNLASLCNAEKLRGLSGAAEGLKIRRPSGLGGSTPPPGTNVPPSNVGRSMLVGLPTGALANILSLREGRQLGKVNSEDRLRIYGEVNMVAPPKATLRFAHLQPSMDVITFNLSPQSRRVRTEVSEFLGFAMLQILELKLDYRDGLVGFECDPKRVKHFGNSHF